MAAEAKNAADALLPSTVHVSGVGGFLRWWRDELVALLPMAWQDRLRAGTAIPISASKGGWRTHSLIGGAWVPGPELPAPAGAPVAALRNANVWLLLDPREAVVRDAWLPFAAEGSLDEALSFELDRLTPLPAERAWFGHRVDGRDESEKQLKVRIAVTPREVAEGHVSALRSAGARVLGVGLMEEFAGESASINLLPADQRDRASASNEARVTRVLAALALALVVAIFLHPLWLKREAVIALVPRVEKAKAAADVSDRLAKEIETLAQQHNFLLARKHTQPPMALLVEELTKQLPDNTWVQQLDVKPGSKTREVQIAGETGSSSALVEVLERSGLFANATFKSPLTKGATPNTERYLLAAELKLRDLPAPIPEDALAKVPAATPPAEAPK